MKKIQHTKQEWTQLIEDLNWNPDIIIELEKNSYIIKSELQQKVEEAEKMYKKWESCIKNFYDKDSGEYKIIEGFYDVIQLLKQSHPEFKK